MIFSYDNDKESMNGSTLSAVYALILQHNHRVEIRVSRARL